MRASCCFIEPSCRKVEIHYPYSPGKMNTALSDKMTLTRLPLVLSGCFIILFMCGHSTVLCALNEEAGNQPNMTRTDKPVRGVYRWAFLPRQTPEEVFTKQEGGVNSSRQEAHNGFGATAATDESTVTCGSGHFCESLCALCESYFGGPTMDCLSALFGHSCLPKFTTPMNLMNTTDWCVWGNVNSLYSNLSFCTEEMSDCLQIPWPNPLVEQLFVEIHSTYFKECPTEEFSDPAPATVFALVITPICLIPVMVSLVVLKTKNGDGSS